MSRISIIGAGAWGTAIAIVLGRKGRHHVRLWAYEPEVRAAILSERINTRFLAGHGIPESVEVVADLATAARDCEILVSAMPSQHCRPLFEQLAPHVTREMMIASATKGLEQNTLLRMTEVIDCVVRKQAFAARIGAISGPSFAAEVARGDPTAITVASGDAELATTVQREFSDQTFRVYTNDDVVGVELGGALKNVIAIAAGVCDGLGLGYNSIAGLITRGLAEITRLAVACGGRADTMSGLAGLGDLVLTCTGGLSRNRTVGVELGRGRKLQEIIAGMHGMVAEGVYTTDAALQLSRKHGVEMPITEQMHAILSQDKSPRAAIQELMTRSAKSEIQFAGGAGN